MTNYMLCTVNSKIICVGPVLTLKVDIVRKKNVFTLKEAAGTEHARDKKKQKGWLELLG